MFYIVAIVRHRGTVGAWRNRGDLRVLLMFLSTSLQSSGLQDFFKRLLPKLSATRTLRLCCSLCLRHLRDIVFMFSPPCSPPLCVTFICSRLTLSLHISEEPHLLPKLSATHTLRLCRSLCLRHLREIVFMFSPPCSPLLCVTFICSRLTLSLHLSEEPHLLPKLSATRTLRLCRSLCLRHLREIVCFHLRVLPLSV